MTISRKLWEILSTPETLEALKGTAENLHLEGKAGRSPLTDDLKGYLSQALSGFANSDGGVLVLGLRTERRGADEPDVITAVEPFEGFVAAASEIHSLVGQVVVPIVEGVEVRPIASKGSPTHGYVVVLVPPSERPPHRAMLRKIGEREYWKRSGDSFYRMEHFDLEDVFGRRRGPRLKLGWRVAERGREQRGGR